MIKVYKNRDEWLRNRKGIGGSDAAAVMGLSPWKSNVELWEEMTGRRFPADISDNPAVHYGTFAEEHLRALFALDFPEYKVSYKPNNIWESPQFSYMHASLDGWLEDENGNKGILEIKTANLTSGILADRWKNGVPDPYYCQILHYFLVTGFGFAILKAQLKFQFPQQEMRIETRHYTFNRQDCLEDMEILAEAEREFWQCVEDDVTPPLKLCM